jgi:hypothetical protein
MKWKLTIKEKIQSYCNYDSPPFFLQLGFRYKPFSFLPFFFAILHPASH